jgi:hypothetical protein
MTAVATMENAKVIGLLPFLLATMACNPEPSTKVCVPLDAHPSLELPDRLYWCDGGVGSHPPPPDGMPSNTTNGWYLWTVEPGRECDGCLWDGVEDEIAWHA